MDVAARSLVWWRRYSSLDLGRVASLAYSLIGLAALIPQLFTDPRTMPVRPLGIAGLLGLGAAVVVTFVRRRLFVGEPLVTPALVVLTGVAMADPYSAIGLALHLVPPQSLYGSIRSTIVRTVLLCAAVPVAVFLSPVSTAPHAWYSVTVLGSIPSMLLLAALIRVLQAAVVRQIQAAERIRLLIATGTELLNVTESDQLRAITKSAADELARTTPGTVGMLLRFVGEDAVVVGLAGVQSPPPGTAVPAGGLRRIAQDGREATRLPEIDPYLGRLWWRGTGLDVGQERWVHIVGGRNPVADDVLDAFTLLANQWTEGEIKCRAHAKLAYRGAGHDTITGLFNRGEFLNRLEQTLRDPSGIVSVIVFDLDEFKTVNDTYGHQAGDRMLQIVGDRLAEVLSRPSPISGFAARLGGDEFAAVLVSTDRAAIVERVHEMHQRLQEPITIADTELPVRVSLGLAFWSEGLSAADLLDHADLAMYRAKATGKRRIAEYTPELAAAPDRTWGRDRQRDRVE